VDVAQANITTAKYPRKGFSIAPLALAQILQIPLPESLTTQLPSGYRVTHLAELDETVWLRRDEQFCQQAASVVIAEVMRRYRSLPHEITAQPLEHLTGMTGGVRLVFSNRTRNALERSGLLERWLSDEPLCVGDLLTSTPRLGPVSFIDALVGFENALLETLDRPAPRQLDIDTQMRLVALQALRNPRASSVMLGDPRLEAPLFVGVFTRRDRRDEITLEAFANRIVKAEHHLDNYPLEIFEQFRASESSVRMFVDMKLEDELAEVVRVVASERDAQAFIAHRGWDGKEPKSLREIAEELDISHERVRQICAQVDDQLGDQQFFMPALDRAITAIAKAAPCATSDAAEMLQETGTANEAFSPSGVLDAAAVLGRDVPWELMCHVNGEERVDADPSRVRRYCVLGLARRAMVERGYTSVSALLAAANENECRGRDDLRNILESIPTVSWLDAQHEMFWLTDTPNNALASAIMKTLAAHSPQESCELREAIKRSSVSRSGPPPSWLIAEFCRQLPMLEVDEVGRFVTAHHQTALESELAPTEWVMIHTLKTQGGVITRSRFRDMCAQAHIPRATFYFYLDVAPFIEELERGIYALRGSSPDPATVEILIDESLRLNPHR